MLKADIKRIKAAGSRAAPSLARAALELDRDFNDKDTAILKETERTLDSAIRREGSNVNDCLKLFKYISNRYT